MLRLDDPRVQPGAYIDNGKDLFRVLDYETMGKRIKVEDCRYDLDTSNPDWEWIPLIAVERDFELATDRKPAEVV
jgi:hypothetical protein